jgi:ribosomal protein S18 acetylase RimI-like enzyme
MRNDPLLTINKLLAERYTEAKAVFWAGSVSKNQGTATSDLDLVIIYDHLPNAYREAYLYEEWPIDAFVHDRETLRFFFEESRTGNGISGLLHMILQGREITEPTDFSESIKAVAQHYFEAGPASWDKARIDKERFHITDALDDIISARSRSEQIALAAGLYESLSQFYFRTKNQWSASGKLIAYYLQQDNPEFSKDFTQSFDNLFEERSTAYLERLIKSILAPYGGLLWDGYRSEAAPYQRLAEPAKVFSEDEKYQYYLDETGKGEVYDLLLKNIQAYNESHVGRYIRNFFALYIKSNNKIIAALNGHSLGDNCFINLVWVNEECRHQGLGSKLFAQLESYARSKNCKMIQLETYDFQAKGFYDQLGYTAVATFKNVFMGHTRYFMEKVLS